MLWNTERQVRVLSGSGGVAQDVALTDVRLWPRVIDAAVSLGMRADRVPRCANCSQPGPPRTLLSALALFEDRLR